MDKFGDAFKATIAVFHGIIATWLFLEFSDTKVTEFYFVILLVFFTVANIFVWRSVLFVWSGVLYLARLGCRKAKPPAATETTQQALYRPTDVFGLTLVAFGVGLFAAYLQNKDVVLNVANRVADWHRTASATPFQLVIAHVSTHTMQDLDAREPQLVQAAAGGAYLRVFMKDLKFAYEGYPGWVPGKLDEPQVILTPACRLWFDPTEAKEITALQRVEGPGVYLNLSQASSIEIIDSVQSPCTKAP